MMRFKKIRCTYITSAAFLVYLFVCLLVLIFIHLNLSTHLFIFYQSAVFYFLSLVAISYCLKSFLEAFLSFIILLIIPVLQSLLFEILLPLPLLPRLYFLFFWLLNRYSYLYHFLTSSFFYF